MLPEQESLIYNNFVDLVRDCDLERIMRSLSLEDPTIHKILDNVKIEDDRRHNNRCILFQLLKCNTPNVFQMLTHSLRKHKFEELANKLENKPAVQKPKHSTILIKPPEFNYAYNEKLIIDVKCASKFNDTEDYCYKTRSKNRGQVLIINNIVFNGHYKTRQGAEVDDHNLKELFEKIGFAVEMYRNLSKDEIKSVIEKFSQREYEIEPDIGVVIIMSHGKRVDNKTVIVGTDGQVVEEEWVVRQFNNQTCRLFRHKPKILVFNICRGELVDNLYLFTQHTQSDAAFTKPPDMLEQDDRYYSDLIICHPSVEGFQAHRDTLKGCWYIELLCNVFMEKSQKEDVETMLKQIEMGLRNRISEKLTRQTSTFLNIAFKTCYLNPGIYEEDGVMVKFKN